MRMKIIVTGCAGFIGSHVAEFLLKRGDIVKGIDNLSDYYDVEIKKRNLLILKKYKNFTFHKENVLNTRLISIWKPEKICHLASMAGVRFSIEQPCLYVRANIEAFTHLLKESVENGVKHIVFASSSSVYGINKHHIFSESQTIDNCNSPYACSKRCMELMAQTYCQLYQISVFGLRFFTVYGPRGRPDMAPYKFLNSILECNQFEKYGDGTTSRDYTYIDDVVDGVIAAIDNNNNKIKYDVFNIGNSKPKTLNQFIETCENVTGKKALYKQLPLQLGDVPHTCADINKAKQVLGYNPKISLEEGLTKTMMFLKKDKKKMVFCINGDCYKQDCHHCFPVRNCEYNHENCKKNGCCNALT